MQYSSTTSFVVNVPFHHIISKTCFHCRIGWYSALHTEQPLSECNYVIDINNKRHFGYLWAFQFSTFMLTICSATEMQYIKMIEKPVEWSRPRNTTQQKKNRVVGESEKTTSENVRVYEDESTVCQWRWQSLFGSGLISSLIQSKCTLDRAKPTNRRQTIR